MLEHVGAIPVDPRGVSVCFSSSWSWMMPPMKASNVFIYSWSLIYPLKVKGVIFHSYVSLPKGNILNGIKYRGTKDYSPNFGVEHELRNRCTPTPNQYPQPVGLYWPLLLKSWVHDHLHLVWDLPVIGNSTSLMLQTATTIIARYQS